MAPVFGLRVSNVYIVIVHAWSSCLVAAFDL